MAAPDPFSARSSDDPIAVEAGAWLARRDRGLTAAEQDAFLQWLRADPRHRIALARLDRAWTALDSLAAWQPADGARPNPDLLAPARRARRLGWIASLAGLGAAASLALLFLTSSSPGPEPASVAPGVRVIARPERQSLADGSVAEVNHGGRFEIAFAENERRVRLRDGEVHLTVAKDAYAACAGAHAIAIVTEWDEFKTLDYAKIFAAMPKPAFLFDGRNIVDLVALRKIGFTASGIGKPA